MKIVIVGEGAAGLLAAAAGSWHREVVVLDQERLEPAPDVESAAASAFRPGAPQIVQPHAVMARCRELLHERLPDVYESLLAAGAAEAPLSAFMPPSLADRSARPGDERLTALMSRRSTLDWVLQRAAVGQDNFAADREAAEQAIAANPGIVADVRANRAFLVRAVRYLTSECGTRQFLDIGTGLPTAGNTHEVAQAAAPDARIVYVDNDPVVLSHAQALLTSSPEGATAYLDADLRDTSAILRAAGRTLDFGEPVALMLLIILHLIPDTDDPYGIVAGLVRALPAGSHVVLAHPAGDIRAAQMAEMTRRVNERMSGPKATTRDRAAVTRFFDGLELLEPGVVQPQQWRPEPGVVGPAQVTAWCGVARKR